MTLLKDEIAELEAKLAEATLAVARVSQEKEQVELDTAGLQAQLRLKDERIAEQMHTVQQLN